MLATRDRGPLFYGFVIDGEHVYLAALVVALDARGHWTKGEEGACDPVVPGRHSAVVRVPVRY